MSGVSESQFKAQPDQQNSSYDLSIAPMKRKRGRPRKDEVSGSEPNKRIQQCRLLLKSPSSSNGLVGQEVSGSFIGVFDAGYLLTVQVGSSGPILRGMVFDPRFAVPVSTENDVAPHLPMLRRNEFSYPVAEGLINQGAVSSQAYMVPKEISIQYVQAKKPPTTSSFTSPVPNAPQLNLMEVTPSHSSHVPQTATETKEPQLVSETSNVILEGAAAKPSDLSPLNSIQLLQSEKNENTLIAVELSDVSEAPANASRPSNDTNPSDASVVTPSQVSKPSQVSNPLDTSTVVLLDASKPSNIFRDASAEAASFNVSNLSDVSKEGVTHASDEPLNIPKTLLSTSTDASLDVSDVVPMDISKPLNVSREAASGIAKKFTLDEQEPLVTSQDAAFATIQVLERQTVKTGGMAEGNSSSGSMEESLERLCGRSEEPKVNDVLMVYNNSEIPKGDKSEGFGEIIGCMTQLSQPNIAVAEKLEDAPTAPQASTFQP